MTRTLPRIVLAVAAMVGLGMALALGFEETGVDFQNPDITTVYVSLDTTPAGLSVQLASAQPEEYVGTVDVADKLNDYAAADSGIFTSGDIVKLLGNHCWVTKAFPGLFETAHTSTWFRMIRIKHDGALPAVQQAYMQRFSELGYTLSEHPVTSNIEVVMASRGDETIRVVFARNGANTYVTLSPS